MVEALDGGLKETLEGGRGEARLDGGLEKPTLEGGLKLLVDGRDDPEEEGRLPDVSTESGFVLVLRGSAMMVVVVQALDALPRVGTLRSRVFASRVASTSRGDGPRARGRCYHHDRDHGLQSHGLFLTGHVQCTCMMPYPGA